MPVHFGVTKAPDLFIANFRKASISDTTYFLFIDLSNGSGAYKHPANSGIRIGGINATLIKSDMQDRWLSQVGVVTFVDTNFATISWVRALGTVGLRDTAKIQDDAVINYLPFTLNTTVESGETIAIANNFTENVVSLANPNTIEDISGAQSQVGVGDIILKVEKVSGSGTAIAHYNFYYTVE